MEKSSGLKQAIILFATMNITAVLFISVFVAEVDFKKLLLVSIPIYLLLKILYMLVEKDINKDEG